MASMSGITPDSSLPSSPTNMVPTTVGLGGFAALPPPISASSARSSFASPPPSINQGGAGANYNINMAPQAPSYSHQHAATGQSPANSFMQPLQPNLSSGAPSTSFMAPMQPSSRSAAAPTPSPGAIQWNNPMSPSASAATFASGQNTLQPSPAIQWGKASPQPTPSPSLAPTSPMPPGYGSSILQPTKRETTFDWSDLDPMR